MTPSTETTATSTSSNGDEFTFVVAKPRSEGDDDQHTKTLIIEACRQIRTEVFIKEQEIPVDIEYDGLDGAAYHVLCHRISSSNDDNGVDTTATAAAFVPVATGRLLVVADVNDTSDVVDGNNGQNISKKEGIIARIAVRKNFRGKRLGSEIVRKLESIALDLNLSSLSLKPHKHLKKFYQGLGFATVPGQTVFAGKHELIVMKKEY